MHVCMCVFFSLYFFYDMYVYNIMCVCVCVCVYYIDALHNTSVSIWFYLPPQHRGSTYKRHAVKDDDMQTNTDVGHHNMYLHTRQFVENVKKVNKKGRKPPVRKG